MEYRSIIEESELFDENFYIEHYRDLSMLDELPLEHFVNHGLNEDRKPNEWFDPIWYREYYKDVDQNGIYPFIHYILYGEKEFRFANENRQKEYESLQDSFDAVAYKNNYEDLQKLEDKFDFLWHYVCFGKREGRTFCAHSKKEATVVTTKTKADIPIINGFDEEMHIEVNATLQETISDKEFSKQKKSTDTVKIKYKIETFDEKGIRGWLYNIDAPDSIMECRVLVDGVEQTLVSNSTFREDLKRKKLTNGIGGIRLTFDKKFFSKKEYTLCLELPNGKKECKTFNNFETEEYNIKIDSVSETGIRGWLVDLLNPEKKIECQLLVNNTHFIAFNNNHQRGDLKKAGLSNGLGGFQVDFIADFFNIGTNTITIILPNKSKLSRDIVVEKSEDKKTYCSVNRNVNNVTVVVPIYNAADDLQVCIERLVKYTSKKVHILLIDDASTDPKIGEILESAKSIPNFKIEKNKKNLGFTKTVNKGIRLAGEDDVVFLNSDARVTPRWLDGMLFALYSDADIATVTAMSDRAGAFSAPSIGNENDLPEGVSEIEYAIAFRRRAKGLYPTVPTGNGFCMLVKRAAIADIGSLDEEAFPRGYGEENDFCMRARKNGWRNIIDDCTYVFHDRNKSFGETKTDLIKSGRDVIDTRYPDYAKAIAVFKNSQLITASRYFARQALKDCVDSIILPRVLYVVATQTGGTPQTNKDLMFSLDREIEPWLLHSDSKTMSLYKVQKDSVNTLICQHELLEHVDPLTHSSIEYDRVIANWLYQFDFEIVHIRHLGWHSLSLPKIAKNFGAFVIYSFHDFYSICPTVKLIDGENRYCGGDCSKGSGNCKAELWPSGSLPELRDKWIKEWQRIFSKSLKYCDHYITTSNSAKETILASLPTIEKNKFHVIPHGRDFIFTSIENTYNANTTFDILVPGNINIAKGFNIINQLLLHDEEKRLHFHILGNCNEEFSHPRFTLHGSYKREDFAKYAKNINPTVGAVFSIWDETWCHTLTELWSVGLPVMALNFGTITNRVQTSGAGWIYDFKNIELLYKDILSDLSSEKKYYQAKNAVLKWQLGKGLVHNNTFMASSYLQVYYMATNRKKKISYEKIAVVCPSNSQQSMAPGSTHIRVWERTINTPDSCFIYIRMTPQQLIAAITEKEIKNAIIQRNVLSKDDWILLKKYISSNDFSYILDIDDDLLNVPKDKDTDGRYLQYTSTMKDIIMNAKLVTVSTKNLKNRFLKLNRNIELLPNVLSGRLWKGNLDKVYKKNTFKALYMGSATHSNDFLMILPALKKVAEINPNFRIKVIGIYTDEIDNIPTWIEKVDIPDNCKNYPEFVAWLKKQVSDIDIGLAPLEDKSFNNTKSPLKILEYAALGLPCIASEGEVYTDMARESPHTKVVKNTIDPWVNAILEYVNNVSAIESQGEEMREWVAKNHFMKKDEFCQIVRSLTTQERSVP